MTIQAINARSAFELAFKVAKDGQNVKLSRIAKVWQIVIVN